MLSDVSPFDHVYEGYPAVAVSKTDPPSQKEVAPPAIIATVGGENVDIVNGDEDAEHPDKLVTVTV